MHGRRKRHAWKGDQARIRHTDTPGTYHNNLPAFVARARRDSSQLHLDVVFDVCRDNVDAPLLVVVLNARPPPLLARDCDGGVLGRPGGGGMKASRCCGCMREPLLL